MATFRPSEHVKRRADFEKAYASVRPNRRNFVGFYADISTLSPDAGHRLEREVPAGLKPGQYQGVFVENVETGYTKPVVSAPPPPRE